MSELLKKFEQKAINIMFPEKNKLTPPSNRVWIAIILATAIFGLIDIITMVSVSIATYWYYGLLVLFAGIVTLVGHEILFANPYARLWQKVITVIGFFTSVTVSVVIGLLSIYEVLIPTGIEKHYIGLGMVGFSFLALFFHGGLFIVYFFLDEQIRTKQSMAQGLAQHEVAVSQFDQTKALVSKVNELEKELKQISERGEEVKFQKAHEALTGRKDPTLPNS